MSLIGGVTGAIVGVSDRQPHLGLYCGWLGFEVVAEGVIDQPTGDPLQGKGRAASLRTPNGIPVTLCEPSG